MSRASGDPRGAAFQVSDLTAARVPEFEDCAVGACASTQRRTPLRLKGPVQAMLFTPRVVISNGGKGGQLLKAGAALPPVCDPLPLGCAGGPDQAQPSICLWPGSPWHTTNQHPGRHASWPSGPRPTAVSWDGSGLSEATARSAGTAAGLPKPTIRDALSGQVRPQLGWIPTWSLITPTTTQPRSLSRDLTGVRRRPVAFCPWRNSDCSGAAKHFCPCLVSIDNV